MHDPSHRGRQSRTRSWFACCTVIFALLLSGCATIQRQGDRAFEHGNCEQALENYDEAAENGVKDPKMFHNAALCALKLGDFAAAEKYYSQALRFGAGLDVARELAGFYVRTSNYVSAIRVYQYLLYQETDKQPVYNNLGTALMYAAQPFDAESYLMVAQQLNPKDPSPYLNLGLLYDRHLKQPWLAINFYECYDELTRGRAKNSQMVRQRASELHDRYDRLYEADAVECGKPYQPNGTTTRVANLREVVEEGLPDEAEEPAAHAPDDPNAEPPVIERQVTDDDTAAAETTATPAVEQARKAYRDGRWADAVGLFTSVSLAQLTPMDQKFLGIAYQKQANWAMAGHWLELALTTTEDSEILSALFDVYTRTNQEDRIAGLCKRYGKSSKYEKIAAEYCKSADQDKN